MDIMTLVSQLTENGEFGRIANNPLAQFGTPARRRKGPEILPVQNREENQYSEDGFKARTIVANSGDRYSPAQLKHGDKIGSTDVKFGNYDIARELTGRDFDAVIKLLSRNMDQNSALRLMKWVNIAIDEALLDLEEAQRWQALVNGQCALMGDNGYLETVQYFSPPGHRVTPLEAWSDDTVDPLATAIHPLVQLAENEGFMISRIVARGSVVAKLTNNAIMRNRSATNDYNAPGRASLSRINAIIAEDGLPPIEKYDLRYRTQAGSIPFMPDDSMLLIAETERDETLALEDREEIIPNTLGYFGRGRPVGESTPGLVVRSWFMDDKPPRVKAEGWGTGLPVITEPEAVFAITGIS